MPRLARLLAASLAAFFVTATAAYADAPIIKQGAGNPNGFQSCTSDAVVFYKDTVTAVYYVCTSAGGSSGAVWDVVSAAGGGGNDNLGADADRGDIIVSVSGTNADLDELDVEAELEAVIDLPDLQGVLTDAQAAATLHRDSEVKDGDLVDFDDQNGDFAATNVDEAIEELVTVNASGPNAADGKVNWEQLVDVPAGFADGTDDGGAGGAPTTADYLVGTADAGLSAEIVVGTTPGGVLGGTWASPTLDADSVGATELDLTDTYPITGTADLGGGTLEIPNGTTLPATCAVGAQFMDTDATSGQRHYLCESTNTWVLQGDGSATGGSQFIDADTDSTREIDVVGTTIEFDPDDDNVAEATMDANGRVSRVQHPTEGDQIVLQEAADETGGNSHTIEVPDDLTATTTCTIDATGRFPQNYAANCLAEQQKSESFAIMDPASFFTDDEEALTKATLGIVTLVELDCTGIGGSVSSAVVLRLVECTAGGATCADTGLQVTLNANATNANDAVGTDVTIDEGDYWGLDPVSQTTLPDAIYCTAEYTHQ